MPTHFPPLVGGFSLHRPPRTTGPQNGDCSACCSHRTNQSHQNTCSRPRGELLFPLCTQPLAPITSRRPRSRSPGRACARFRPIVADGFRARRPSRSTPSASRPASCSRPSRRRRAAAQSWSDSCGWPLSGCWWVVSPWRARGPSPAVAPARGFDRARCNAPGRWGCSRGSGGGDRLPRDVDAPS